MFLASLFRAWSLHRFFIDFGMDFETILDDFSMILGGLLDVILGPFSYFSAFFFVPLPGWLREAVFVTWGSIFGSNFGTFFVIFRSLFWSRADPAKPVLLMTFTVLWCVYAIQNQLFLMIRQPFVGSICCIDFSVMLGQFWEPFWSPVGSFFAFFREHVVA